MEKEIVTNFENLYRSYKKVKSGKKFNSGTARFSNLSLEGTIGKPNVYHKSV